MTPNAPNVPTAAPTTAVTVERRIAARPETVFTFFTDRDRWLSWMGEDGTFSFIPGGAFRTRVTDCDVAIGHFVTLDPPRRVVFTWGWEGGAMGLPPGSTTIEITLEPDGDAGTLLRLVHSGLPPETETSHRDGWTHYAERLAARAEAASLSEIEPDVP